MNENEVKYLIIGGVAVNIHGYSRATGDLDIWYNPTAKNFVRLLKTISAFGYDTSDLEKSVNLATKGFIRIPLSQFYLELLSNIDGKMQFDEVYKRAYSFTINSTIVKVIGYDELIQNKIMSRRAKGLEDIAQLEKRKSKEKIILVQYDFLELTSC